ncbi:hypothetical protein LOSG293_350020 [Secundilactobacillus oryzae JCM 18671]|uniref:Uncharacterized protein n=2 Tax=Secundilactobacillus oryzae TaxID=1202668 RepID=A0A081BKE6_9LACO|nr:hypothetical protein LOSG293_350020 [Secundilactobacillus oryzae JCM 18671]
MGITVGGELTAQADTNYSNVSGTETTSANAAQPDEKTNTVKLTANQEPASTTTNLLVLSKDANASVNSDSTKAVVTVEKRQTNSVEESVDRLSDKQLSKSVKSAATQADHRDDSTTKVAHTKSNSSSGQWILMPDGGSTENVIGQDGNWTSIEFFDNNDNVATFEAKKGQFKFASFIDGSDLDQEMVMVDSYRETTKRAGTTSFGDGSTLSYGYKNQKFFIASHSIKNGRVRNVTIQYDKSGNISAYDGEIYKRGGRYFRVKVNADNFGEFRIQSETVGYGDQRVSLSPGANQKGAVITTKNGVYYLAKGGKQELTVENTHFVFSDDGNAIRIRVSEADKTFHFRINNDLIMPKKKQSMKLLSKRRRKAQESDLIEALANR